jgi:hypothetical protein
MSDFKRLVAFQTTDRISQKVAITSVLVEDGVLAKPLESTH